MPGKSLTNLFICGEANSRGKNYCFLSKKAETAQNMVANSLGKKIPNWRSDLAFEAVLRSKWPQILIFTVGLGLMEVLFFSKWTNSSKNVRKSSILSPKILINLSKLKFSIYHHVSRNPLCSEPCYSCFFTIRNMKTLHGYNWIGAVCLFILMINKRGHSPSDLPHQAYLDKLSQRRPFLDY